MFRAIIAGLLISTASAAAAPATGAAPPATKATPLISKNLQGIPGKEGTMLLVEYPPGGADLVHRHHASVFVYVLEGHVEMQVRGGKPVTLTKGQAFFEAPGDVHVVGRNLSKTQPARFIAFFVKDKGAPLVTPAA